MSSEAQVPSAPPAQDWPVLSPHERRVLGVLVEKAKTTPDAYPMSLNALTTGCNQKSNRDPLLNLSDEDVEEALASCQKRGLVMKITGSRVDRWRHLLYEAWRVEKVDMAVLTELLLRGPQTEGELRARASRMEPIPDLDVLRGVLRRMAERKLIVWLGEEGRRGTTLTHGFHDPRELEALRAAAPVVAAAPSEPRPRTPEPALADALAQLAELRETVAQLQATVAELSQRVAALQQPAG
ncbi:MAG: YceH family protein [Planctomycetia bacterium]|nr:YceH family protein [Planctomycetia bacterium]